MLADQVKTALASNQIAVVIGARGTEKSLSAQRLAAEWEQLGIRVLRMDASGARFPEDLNGPLAEALGCDASNLHLSNLAEDTIIRVILDRCDCLFEQPWVSEWQEQWRALLTAKEAQGRLAAVLYGRPLFRQIAGGDASPLLNAGRVITVQPLSSAEMQNRYICERPVSEAIRKKTGGHPVLTSRFVETLEAHEGDYRQTVKTLVANEGAYLVQLVQDHPLGGRAILGELLRERSPIHESALISQHFAGAHAVGKEAIDDLCACGLVERVQGGDCQIAANLLRSIEGLKEVASSPDMEIPAYDAALMDACWRCLFLSENQLRQIIADRMSAVDSAWWVLHVQPEVRALAEGRKKKEVVIAAKEEDESHPLMYLTLSELFELIILNWGRVFRASFAPLSLRALQEMAQQIEAIRNRLAHSRPVSAHQLREFEMLSKRLGLL